MVSRVILLCLLLLNGSIASNSNYHRSNWTNDLPPSGLSPLWQNRYIPEFERDSPLEFTPGPVVTPTPHHQNSISGTAFQDNNNTTNAFIERIMSPQSTLQSTNYNILESMNSPVNINEIPKIHENVPPTLEPSKTTRVEYEPTTNHFTSKHEKNNSSEIIFGSAALIIGSFSIITALGSMILYLLSSLKLMLIIPITFSLQWAAFLNSYLEYFDFYTNENMHQHVENIEKSLFYLCCGCMMLFTFNVCIFLSLYVLHCFHTNICT